MNVCLDAWAVLAWLQGEAAAEDVERLLEPDSAGERPLVAALNLGEVYYWLSRSRGRAVADQLWTESVAGLAPWRVVPPSVPRTLSAARLKARFPVSFADAFAMATALEHDLPLATGDREIRAAHEAAGLRLVWLGPA